MLPPTSGLVALIWVSGVMLVTAACGGAQPKGVVAGAVARPTPVHVEVYPGRSWMARLDPPMNGDAIPLACVDQNRDHRLNAADRPELASVDIRLGEADACLPPWTRREWFRSSDPLTCDGGSLPVLIVAVAGGGTDLLDTNEGVSAGLIDIVNRLRAASAQAGLRPGVILTTAAIKDADLPQTRMEEWLAAELQAALDQAPCLRAVIVGHSHGAVVVTTVLAALEPAYGARLYGVLFDRSLLYYDHAATERPAHAAVLNVFQTNEGWHGEPLLTSNVVNLDMSSATAPREPREGPEPIVAVAHSTLDDSMAAQEAVAAQVLAWLLGG